MKIALVFNERTFFIMPDPAMVKVGTEVEWELFSTESNIAQIRWTVYFDQGSPFGQLLPKSFSVDTHRTTHRPPSPFPGIVHHGTIGKAFAVSSGDYKYGVRAEIPSNWPVNQTVLADDDPLLIVVS